MVYRKTRKARKSTRKAHRKAQRKTHRKTHRKAQRNSRRMFYGGWQDPGVMAPSAAMPMSGETMPMVSETMPMGGETMPTTMQGGRKSRRGRRRMFGGFQTAPPMTEVQPVPRVHYTSPFVTNMVRY